MEILKSNISFLDDNKFKNMVVSYQSGIIKTDNNFAITAATSNIISIDTGMLVVFGTVIKNNEPFSLSLNNFPLTTQRMRVVFQLSLANNEYSYDIFTTPTDAQLIHNDLYKSNEGIYQLELARFTLSQSGITDVIRTVNILTDPEAQPYIEIGNVTTETIASNLPAEVDIENRVDDVTGRTVTDFNMRLPKGADGGGSNVFSQTGEKLTDVKIGKDIVGVNQGITQTWSEPERITAGYPSEVADGSFVGVHKISGSSVAGETVVFSGIEQFGQNGIDYFEPFDYNRLSVTETVSGNVKTVTYNSTGFQTNGYTIIPQQFLGKRLKVDFKCVDMSSNLNGLVSIRSADAGSLSNLVSVIDIVQIGNNSGEFNCPSTPTQIAIVGGDGSQARDYISFENMQVTLADAPTEYKPYATTEWRLPSTITLQSATNEEGQVVADYLDLDKEQIVRYNGNVEPYALTQKGYAILSNWGVEKQLTGGSPATINAKYEADLQKQILTNMENIEELFKIISQLQSTINNPEV